ncbi:MAG: hypothetical protein HDR19_00870 [Lachnospiraceae bacterium]|nr:hypothetical protein [Lachnospiraceae bacterium]
METLQENIAKLKKDVKKLGKYSEGGTTKTRLKSHLESLVKTYNTYKKNAGKISDDETKEQIEKLEKLFADNEKALKKVGLKKSDKKLELDSDIFDEADQKTINKLFTGRNSFAKQADKIIRKIEECADKVQNSVKEHTFSSLAKYSSDDMDLALFFITGKDNANILSGLGEDIDNGLYNEDEMKRNLSLFVNLSGSDWYDNEYLDKVKALCENNKNELSKIGITVENTDSKITMEYDDDMTNFDREAFINLFGKNAEFVNGVKECFTDGFNQVIKAEKIGVSIIDTYA